MSETDSTSDSSDPQTNQRQGRQVARRAFAGELNDATHTFQESDDERAPVFALLPTGEAANRFFVVGTITEIRDVGSDSEYWQARIVDPTGTVFVYAGQYQPDAAALLSQLEPPAYVAVVGKPNTFETDDGIFVSLRPESLTVVDDETRDRWVAETAAHTHDRIAAFDAGEAPYVEMVRDVYEPDIDTYREVLADLCEEEEDAIDDEDHPDDRDVDREIESASDNGATDAEVAAAIADADVE